MDYIGLCRGYVTKHTMRQVFWGLVKSWKVGKCCEPLEYVGPGVLLVWRPCKHSESGSNELAVRIAHVHESC